jgi:hypothetical protein
MGGVTGSATVALAERACGATEADIAIRYALTDRTGVDSVEFMDRIGVEFEIIQTTSGA